MPMKYPSHPGRMILQDCMEPLRMSIEETALKLNISPEELSRVINGESSVTFTLAIRLDNLFGGGASTWYQLQAQYDEAQERNKDDVPEELGPLPIYQQTATVHLEHGRVVYKTFDDEVMAFRIVSSEGPDLSGSPSHGRVDIRFVGDGPGSVQIQLIYQPSPAETPVLVADTLFKAYLEWNAESDEYVGRIDAGEWDRELKKLHAGKETMNALHAKLRERPTAPLPDTEKSDESIPECYPDVLREAEELLHKGTASVNSSALAGV